MDRIIEVKVGGSHISKDSKIAGVRGEANVTKLRITFDKGWDNYAKEVVFWDACGENAVRIMLTLERLENRDITNIYLVPIPHEAMGRAGMLTFAIRGSLGSKIQASVADELEVQDSPNILEPVDPTPSELQQMQIEIEKIKGDIHGAVNAKNAACTAADNALATEERIRAIEGISDLVAAKESAQAAAESAAEAMNHYQGAHYQADRAAESAAEAMNHYQGAHYQADRAAESADHAIYFEINASRYAEKAKKYAEEIYEKISELGTLDLAKTEAFKIISYDKDNKFYMLSAGALSDELAEKINTAISEQEGGVYYAVKNDVYASCYGKILNAEAIDDTIKITVDNLYSGGSANSLPGTVLVYENKTATGGLTNHKDTFWNVCEDVSKYKYLKFKARTLDVPCLAFSFMKKDGTWVDNAGNNDALIKLKNGREFEEYALDLTLFPEWYGEIEYIHFSQKQSGWAGNVGTVEIAEITLANQPVDSWNFTEHNSQTWKLLYPYLNGQKLTYTEEGLKYEQTVLSGGRSFGLTSMNISANDYKALKICVKSPDGVTGLNLDVRGQLTGNPANIWYKPNKTITTEFREITYNFDSSPYWADSIINTLTFVPVNASGDTTGTVIIESAELIPYDTTWDFETPETCLWESPNRETSKVTYEYIAPSLDYSVKKEEAALFICGYENIGTFTLELDSFSGGTGNEICGSNSTVSGTNNRVGTNVHVFGEQIDAGGAKDSISAGKRNTIIGNIKNVFQLGEGLVSAFSGQIQLGKFNKNKKNNLVEIGSGDNALDTKTIFELDKNGLIYTNETLIGGQKLFDKVNTHSALGNWAYAGAEHVRLSPQQDYVIVDLLSNSIGGGGVWVLSCKVVKETPVPITGCFYSFIADPVTGNITKYYENETMVPGVNYIHYVFDMDKNKNASGFGIGVNASNGTFAISDIKLYKLIPIGEYKYDAIISDDAHILDDIGDNKCVSYLYDTTNAIYKVGDSLYLACDTASEEYPLTVYTTTRPIKALHEKVLMLEKGV